MEATPFELTPEQKGMLASLSRETGKPIPALIAEALEDLQEHVRPGQANGGRHAEQEPPSAAHAREARKPFWQRFVEASRRIPDEELDRLPPDLAAQVDHYVYGTPKRWRCNVCLLIPFTGSRFSLGGTRGIPTLPL